MLKFEPESVQSTVESEQKAESTPATGLNINGGKRLLEIRPATEFVELKLILEFFGSSHHVLLLATEARCQSGLRELRRFQYLRGPGFFGGNLAWALAPPRAAGRLGSGSDTSSE